MANLNNDTRIIHLHIQLLNNKHVDIVKERNDYENFLPFDFILHVQDDTYSFPPFPTFTVYEIKKFLSNSEEMIAAKKANVYLEPLIFSSSESHFELSIYDTLEKGEFYIDLWLNLGSLTKGDICDYQKGYRFVVMLDEFERFIFDLKTELAKLLANQSQRVK